MNHQQYPQEEDQMLHDKNHVHDHGSHSHNSHKGVHEMGNVKYKNSNSGCVCILENDQEFQEKLKNGNKAFKQLLVVVIICFIFMIVEIVGGVLSGSLAILTDAAHMCSDVGGFVISMFSIKIGQKAPTLIKTFGYHRAEIIGALASVMIIWAMVIWLAWEATNRIICYTVPEKFPQQCNKVEDIEADIMLITAFISLACNIFNLVALGHCPVPCVDSEKQHSIMDSVMSVYKPHGGHDCGGHGHDHGHGGHSHGGHDHGAHDHAAHDHGSHDHKHEQKHDDGHEGHNHGPGGCSGHKHGPAETNDYAPIKAEGQTEQDFINANKNNVKMQQDSIISRNSIVEDNSPTTKNVENPLAGGHNHNHGDIEQQKTTNKMISGFGGVKTDSHEGHNHGAGGCGGHDHGHSHGHEETNINIRAAVVHVIGDMLQSIGVIIAALAIYLYPQARIADPICTYVFSIIVIITTIPVFKDCMNILMEGKPKEVDNKTLREKILKINQVADVKDLHTWTLAGGKNVMTCHIELVQQDGPSYEDRHRQVHAEVLKQLEGMNIVHVTAQIL